MSTAEQIALLASIKNGASAAGKATELNPLFAAIAERLTQSLLDDLKSINEGDTSAVITAPVYPNPVPTTVTPPRPAPVPKPAPTPKLEMPINQALNLYDVAYSLITDYKNRGQYGINFYENLVSGEQIRASIMDIDTYYESDPYWEGGDANSKPLFAFIKYYKDDKGNIYIHSQLPRYNSSNTGVSPNSNVKVVAKSGKVESESVKDVDFSKLTPISLPDKIAIPEEKRKPFYDLSKNPKLRRDVLYNEVLLGKMEIAMESQFDGMTDSSNYIPKSEQKWYVPTPDQIPYQFNSETPRFWDTGSREITWGDAGARYVVRYTGMANGPKYFSFAALQFKAPKPQVPATSLSVSEKLSIAEKLREKANSLKEQAQKRTSGGVFNQNQELIGNAPLISEEEKKKREIQKLENELRTQKIAGFFPTPRDLAKTLLDDIRINNIDTILEPSAGIGSLAEVIREQYPNNQLDVIEWSYSMKKILELKGFNVVGDNFLNFTGKYDVIIMNPPFENGQDIDHVLHAFSLLNRSGRLAAIVSSTAYSQGDRRKKWADFAEFVDFNGYATEPIKDAFKGSESFKQTGVNVRLIYLQKSGLNGLGSVSETYTEDLLRDLESVGKVKEAWEMTFEEFYNELKVGGCGNYRPRYDYKLCFRNEVVTLNGSYSSKNIDYIRYRLALYQNEGNEEGLNKYYDSLSDSEADGVWRVSVDKEYYRYPYTIAFHLKSIKQALSEGKPVPAKVLAEYPDLNSGLSGKWEKTNIRLQKVNQRINKKTYPKNQVVKRLIKSEEKIENIGRWNDILWRDMYEKGWDAQKNRENKDYWLKFEKEITQINKNLDEIHRVSKSMQRLENKSLITLEEAQILMQMENSKKFCSSLPQTGIGRGGRLRELEKERYIKNLLRDLESVGNTKRLKNEYQRNT